MKNLTIVTELKILADNIKTSNYSAYGASRIIREYFSKNLRPDNTHIVTDAESKAIREVTGDIVAYIQHLLAVENKLKDDVVNAVMANNNTVINDHGGSNELKGICILNNGEVGAILNTNKVFCINEVYLDNGIPHVSTKSISGTVRNMDDLSLLDRFNSTLFTEARHIREIVWLS